MLRSDSHANFFFSTTLSLVILLILLVLWFALDITYIDHAFRFVITPYLGNVLNSFYIYQYHIVAYIYCNKFNTVSVVVWACIGILSKQGHRDNVPTVTLGLVWAILATAITLLIGKIVAIIVGQKRRPLGVSQ